MANRVVLGAFDGTHVLRVSRPGFNVLSTGLAVEQLAFDSRWAEVGRVFMRGSRTFGPFENSFTIPYGVTFAKEPMVLVRFREPAFPSGTFRPFVSNPIQFTLALRPTGSGFTMWWPSYTISIEGTVVYYTVYENFYG